MSKCGLRSQSGGEAVGSLESRLRRGGPVVKFLARITKARGATAWALLALWAASAFLLNIFWYDLFGLVGIVALTFPLALWLAFLGILAAAFGHLVHSRARPASVLLLYVVVF